VNQTQPLTANSSPGLAAFFYWGACAIAIAAYLLELFTLVAQTRLPGAPNGTEALLLLASTATILASLGRQLPLQNVFLAAGVIASVGAIAHGICTVASIPFGPLTFASAGPTIFGELPWSVPFLWVVAVLSSRGAARLILRPWRKLKAYGFWWIGLTAVLTALFDFALEPFATQVKHFWVWRETKFPFTWYAMPLTNPIGWLVTTALILAFVTPALINKQPRSRNSPPDFFPLILWVLAVLLFGIGAATQNLWPPVVYCAAAVIVVGGFAIRGARW
jgi:uncharacterized membrane protein